MQFNGVENNNTYYIKLGCMSRVPFKGVATTFVFIAYMSL